MKRNFLFTVGISLGSILVGGFFLSTGGLHLGISTLLPSMSWIWGNVEAESEGKGAFPAILSLPSLSTIGELSLQQGVLFELLGFEGPRYYLLLFQNYHELRPTGGFIGSFAVVRVFEGKMGFLWVDDSYNLDRFSEGKVFVPPPTPIRESFPVASWYFRDVNWVIDFKDSAQQALFLFQEELRYFPATVKEIPFDGVIALTPAVIEAFLGQLGDVQVNGEVYSAQDFTEELQDRVERRYVQLGEKQVDRKQIIGSLAKELATRVEAASLMEKLALVEIIFRMLQEKHVLIFSKNPTVQAYVEEHDWGGRVVAVDDATDYLLLVDANLASLKTDAKIKRNILYTVREQDEKAVVDLQITYHHTGTPDWKTTQYRTYSRIAAPRGVIFTGVWHKTDGELSPIKDYDIESLYGKEVIGFFLTVAPQESRTVVLQYILPSGIQDTLKKHRYKLLVQKQPGTLAHDLTVDINAFGVIQSWNTDLRVDREYVY